MHSFPSEGVQIFEHPRSSVQRLPTKLEYASIYDFGYLVLFPRSFFNPFWNDTELEY